MHMILILGQRDGNATAFEVKINQSKNMKMTNIIQSISAVLVAGTLISTASALTTKEADAILFMKQEEKMARDVYRALHKKWGVVIFSNIASSEQRHMDALDRLITRYRLIDNTPRAAGKFTYPELQKLHNQLVIDGEASLQDALKVGVMIEKTDIKDLRDALVKTRDQRVRKVFANLLRGSRQHLAAFRLWLQ